MTWLINRNSTRQINNANGLRCICNDILYIRKIRGKAKRAEQVLRIECSRFCTHSISSIERRHYGWNFETKFYEKAKMRKHRLGKLLQQQILF